MDTIKTLYIDSNHAVKKNNRYVYNLVGGIAVHDLPFKAEDMFGNYLGPDGFVIPPLPNTQFPRDNSCWIGNGLTLNPMFWPARRPETLLVAAVYRFHPAFAGGDFKVWWGDPDTDHGPATLEGGDVMPWGNGTVLIGMGERTSPQAVGQVHHVVNTIGDTVIYWPLQGEGRPTLL